MFFFLFDKSVGKTDAVAISRLPELPPHLCLPDTTPFSLSLPLSPFPPEAWTCRNDADGADAWVLPPQPGDKRTTAEAGGAAGEAGGGGSGTWAASFGTPSCRGWVCWQKKICLNCCQKVLVVGLSFAKTRFSLIKNYSSFKDQMKGIFFCRRLQLEWECVFVCHIH